MRLRRVDSALRNPMPTVFRPAPWAISFLLRRLGFHAVILPNRKPTSSTSTSPTEASAGMNSHTSASYSATAKPSGSPTTGK